MPLIKPTRGMLLNKSHPLARGLVGCWLMNEGTGNKVFDLSGNGNTGILQADTHFVPGRFGSALSFDGDGDCVEIGNIKDSMSTTELSVSIWTKRVGLSSTSQEPFFAKGSYYESSSAFFMGRTNTGTRINFSIEQCYAWTVDVLPDNEWVHFAISYKKGSWGKVYRNGVFLKNLSAYDVDIPLASYIARIGGDESSNYFNGTIDAVMIFNRALSASEIALLYREPFCMFERAWRPELTGGQIVNLAGTSTALSSLSTTAKALRKIAGTAVGTSNTTAALSSIRGLLPEMERSWLAEALFNGMSANAFKLGTTLSMGWFWTRVAGCSVLYRGSSMGEIDFAKVLAVSERDSSEVSSPSYLSHYGGADGTSTYFYVIRRFNSCGCQEHTLAAAVKVSIESNGELAQPQPNSIFSSKVEHRNSNKIRLVWFYCPLEQKSQPVSFNVYYDDRTGQIDYQNPLASIGYKGRKFYSFQSDELDSGRYLFAIRAEGPEGLENSSLAQLKIELNTTSLDVINILSAEAV